jgi:lipoyl(octanoyl) transferase
MTKTVQYLNLGRMAYQESFDLQTAINQYLQNNKAVTGFMILVEHPPVFTLGRNRNTDDFLFPIDLVKNQGFEVIESNRGGNVTYHGPGQFVGYLLVNLEHFRKDVQWYVWSLEEWIIRVLAQFGLTADRKPAYRGVWVADEKICALGVAIKRWSTMHGFALNHQTNLDHYHWINPCGITEYGVTSMEKLGCSADADEITEVLKTEFESVFDCRLEPTNLKEVMDLVNSTKA